MHDRPAGTPAAQTAGVGLPSEPVVRPRLRAGTPVLRRSDDEVQLGLHPGRAVVLRGAGALGLLRHLDGTATRAELDARGAACGLTSAQVGEVLEQLHLTGLLEPVLRPAARRRTVRVIGTGVLGRSVVDLLLTAGLDVYLADTDAVAPRPFPRPGDAGGTGRLIPVNHWSKPDGTAVALTVVAVDTVEVDRVLTAHLLRTDQPHLVLRCSGTVLTVGPLVLPGLTACLRCTDLARRDADPGWPVLLRQLTGLHQPVGPVLAAWGAGVAAAQVLAHLGGSVPESAGATLELDESDHLMRWRAWPQHAGCGCAWPGTTDWGP